ncbi:MAG TPA: UDP-N-acetylmuramate dehydrogenase, partial [Polyangiaceae bacterium]|nr:UDP-N-acetylmuramate dehydrogenase [Polyangiaceae bacterium]
IAKWRARFITQAARRTLIFWSGPFHRSTSGQATNPPHSDIQLANMAPLNDEPRNEATRLRSHWMTTNPPPGVLPDVELAPLTSIGLGGRAQYLARVRAAGELAPLLDWAARRTLPVTLLGGGSNVVFADAGVPGLVLVVDVRGESLRRDGDQVEISVGAGEPWEPFVARCVERGWSGLECLSGIPGSVGATPIQNVGAYGQDVSGTLVSVEVFDRASGANRMLLREACDFGYRTSRFKTADAERFIVLGATFRLHEGGVPCIAYPELARHFAGAGAEPPTLSGVRRVVLETRRSKSMLLDPTDENGRSCGSFFLNPELTSGELDALRARLPSPPPVFAQPDGRSKVPAAWLIEQAGFRRGQRFGAVGISSRHALALVCHAGATARQLVDAAHHIRSGVARAFGVVLAPEPRFFGFGSASDALPNA